MGASQPSRGRESGAQKAANKSQNPASESTPSA
jgi:hypothetical protein